MGAGTRTPPRLCPTAPWATLISLVLPFPWYSLIIPKIAHHGRQTKAVVSALGRLVPVAGAEAAPAVPCWVGARRHAQSGLLWGFCPRSLLSPCRMVSGGVGEELSPFPVRGARSRRAATCQGLGRASLSPGGRQQLPCSPVSEQNLEEEVGEAITHAGFWGRGHPQGIQRERKCPSWGR